MQSLALHRSKHIGNLGQASGFFPRLRHVAIFVERGQQSWVERGNKGCVSKSVLVHCNFDVMFKVNLRLYPHQPEPGLKTWIYLSMVQGVMHRQWASRLLSMHNAVQCILVVGCWVWRGEASRCALICMKLKSPNFMQMRSMQSNALEKTCERLHKPTTVKLKWRQIPQLHALFLAYNVLRNTFHGTVLVIEDKATILDHMENREQL